MDFGRNATAADLGGNWSFAYSEGPEARCFTTAGAVEAAGYTAYPCTVPGNFELDLHANGLVGEPFRGMTIAELQRFEQSHVWYWRRFRGEARPGCETWIVFEGLDCVADIYLNGALLAQTDNMLIEHAFPVDGLLREENELLVHIRPAVEAALDYPYPPGVSALGHFHEALYVRKAPHMYGWDIMPRAVSAGLWRPVRLRFLPRERIEHAFLETRSIAADRRSASLVLHYHLRTSPAPGDAYTVAVEGTCGTSTFTATDKARRIGGKLYLHVPGPRLWWTRGRGEPALYDVTFRLLKNGAEVDRLTFTHGIRTIALDRTSTTDALGNGEFCFRLNGEKLFVMGSNWVPVDAYHSRDAARIPRVLELVNDVGCNMLRCWGGNVYEDNVFYDICDRSGVLVWQDFAMACACPPQDDAHRARIAAEARVVVRRLRQHACLALWAGDNEIDMSFAFAGRNPNENRLTRETLPHVLQQEDWTRPYLPSSPYVDEEAYRKGLEYLPENHPWGPRDYYKGDYYRNVLCHFASEIGYHGCPAPESIRKFISPDKVWPYQDNEEWLLHSTDPVPGVEIFKYRVELMARQVRELFGDVPGTLDEFAFASQVSQAEAKKFFIEMFRTAKWRRTGLIWWNIMDGWPQFSDAVVDYYFNRKLAYDFIKRAQKPFLLAMREPRDWHQELVACNNVPADLEPEYRVWDIDTGEVVAQGHALARADATTLLTRVPWSGSWRRFYVLQWQCGEHSGISHYLLGHPPFNLTSYRGWLGRFNEVVREQG